MAGFNIWSRRMDNLQLADDFVRFFVKDYPTEKGFVLPLPLFYWIQHGIPSGPKNDAVWEEHAKTRYHEAKNAYRYISDNWIKLPTIVWEV